MKKLLLTTIAGLGFALCAALWTGCKDKDDCPPCGDSYKTIPQEMKDWALFEEGSWWVYRLVEDTTVFDTVRFVPNSKTFYLSNKSKCSDNNPHSVSCSETILYRLQHSNTDYFPHHSDSTKGSYDEIILYYPHGGGVVIEYSGYYGGGVTFGINPIQINEYYGNFRLIDTINDFKINNLNIVKAFYSSTLADTINTVEYIRDIYWGKSTGLLKTIIYPNSRTWELVNYEVKQ
ncbi:MAG: hypothetical protein M9892_07300 [Bacteroidetes bacterium]|nr:hypothetical protein [Bacteroidota bacterium]